MLRYLVLVALAGAMVAAPTLAPAADEVLNVPPHAQIVLACRSLKPGETSSNLPTGAHLVQIGGTSTRVCKQIAMEKLAAGPNVAAAKTPLDATKSWKRFIAETVTSPL